MIHMPRLQIRNLPMRNQLTPLARVLCQLRYESDTSGVHRSDCGARSYASNLAIPTLPPFKGRIRRLGDDCSAFRARVGKIEKLG
jgi:hypothetical protein